MQAARRKMNENEISRVIIGAAIKVHRELVGPGLLEDANEEALAEELKLRGDNKAVTEWNPVFGHRCLPICD